MLQVDRYDLKTIFEKQRQYRVPLFQRRYVWDQEKQWEPLWEDVQATAERYMESIAENAIPQPHFLGAVVLKQESTVSRALDARSVIDGQQRLTTLQLLIAAARDVCQSLGDLAKQHHGDLNFLVQNTRGVNQEDDKFKVWPTQVDQDEFRRVMSAGSLESVHRAHQNLPPREDNELRVRDAYLYFHESIKSWLGAASDEHQRLKRLDALRDAIYTGLIMVVIDLSQDDDPQIIFESLNARGTPLLESELVKNFLLHMAESRRMDSKALYDKYWSVFESDEDGFWQREVTQGRLYRARVEIFLQHYLTMRTGQEVSATKLFDTFKAFVGKQNNDPEAHLASLKQHGDIFHGFYNAPRNTPEERFFDRMNTLDITTVFPLLLFVFNKYQVPSNVAVLHTFLLDLESFFVRRLICGLTTKNYNRLMLDLQSQIQANGPDIVTATRPFLLSRKGESERWPDDDELLKAFIGAPLYLRVNRARLRMVLQALELQLRTAKSEKVTLPGKLTVEHLLPQAWEQNWPLPKQISDAEEERETLIHTIGNLTLITGSLNPALSNAAWSNKQPEILKHSTLLLNHYFQYTPEWSEDEIRIRSRFLFNTAKVVWPYPIIQELNLGKPSSESTLMPVPEFPVSNKTVPSINSDLPHRLDLSATSLNVHMTYGGTKALGRYEGNQLILLEGSTIKRETHPSLAKSFLEMRRDLAKKGTLAESQHRGFYVLTDDVFFNTPSGAATFVAGCSVNGLREWKEEETQLNLGEWLKRRNK